MTENDLSLDAATLSERYASESLRPVDVAERIAARIDKRGDDGVWISITPRAALIEAARALEARRAAGEALPLYGLPFAVKDNIDVAGVATTAACPAFAYTPQAHAPVVANLLAAGALFVGKTNLDQFATGLVGVRSPYGIPKNPFDSRYIVGGSSSGSGVAVAAGLASFALGTDTAGSGRVPAAFNNIVGLKPSRGVLPTAGVVPACYSLDCVSVFALTVEDAAHVAEIACGSKAAFAPGPRPPRFRFGVPDARGEGLEFLGDAAAAALHERTLARLAELGGVAVPIDFTPFRRAGALLYDGPFVAERLMATNALLAERPEAIEPTVRAILEGATRVEGRAVFAAQAELESLRAEARAALAKVDFLVVPTTPTIFEIAAVQADPLRLNAQLGRYVNFVNLLDLAGIAVPAGFRQSNGLPAGVTLIAPSGQDAALATFASALHRATSDTAGATGVRLPAQPPPATAPADWIAIAVVGAHLSGQPLNHQLTAPGGRFVRAARTAPSYRLHALPDTTPPKPGLVRVRDGGAAIELEVWSLPPAAFGAFVAKVPPPLCIGSLELDDGSRVSGFLCEGHAVEGAPDISRFGGWRNYLVDRAEN
jgi:allophanate hydrolase